MSEGRLYTNVHTLDDVRRTLQDLERRLWGIIYTTPTAKTGYGRAMFLRTEHLDESSGVSDANKPVILNAAGLLDATMLGEAHPVVDTTELVKGSEDATKKMRIEVDGLTSGNTRVLTMADQNIDLTPQTGSFAEKTHADHHTDGTDDIRDASITVKGICKFLSSYFSTNSGTVSLANDGVTNAKLANMATQTVKGRVTAGTGDPQDLTVAQMVALLTCVVDADFAVNGLCTRSAAGTYENRTIVNGSGITITDGDGVGGNPTIGLPTKILTRTFHYVIPIPKATDGVNGEILTPWFHFACTLTFLRVHVAAATNVVFDLTNRSIDTPDSGGTDVTTNPITATTTPTTITINNASMGVDTCLVYRAVSVSGTPGFLHVFGAYTID